MASLGVGEEGGEKGISAAEWIGEAIAELIEAINEEFKTPACEILIEGRKRYDKAKFSARKNPSKHALAIRARMAELQPRSDVRVTVEPVQRVSWGDARHRRTVVVVRFKAEALGERILLIDAEG